MKTTNRPVYGNILQFKDVLNCLSKKDYTLQILENICSVSLPLRRHGLTRALGTLNGKDTEQMYSNYHLYMV